MVSGRLNPHATAHLPFVQIAISISPKFDASCLGTSGSAEGSLPSNMQQNLSAHFSISSLSRLVETLRFDNFVFILSERCVTYVIIKCCKITGSSPPLQPVKSDLLSVVLLNGFSMTCDCELSTAIILSPNVITLTHG